MSMRASFGSVSAAESSSVLDVPSAAASAASRPASAGTATTGTEMPSSRSSAPAGRLVPETSTTLAPAAAALRTRRSMLPPSGRTTTALPATRLTPSVPKKSPSWSPLTMVASSRFASERVGPTDGASS